MKIPISQPSLGERETAYVVDALSSGELSNGAYVARFERELAAYVGGRHGIATLTGTAALHLALAGLGIGPGDEVILPALTYVATANAVAYTGATPVLADVEPRSWGLDPDDAARRITPRTRGIIAVHLFGLPCRLDAIGELARARGLWLVEDAAQALGATHGGRRAGSFGAASCFSFYGNKVLATGQGGLVVCDDDALDARMLHLRTQATERPGVYRHDRVGFNYRMTNLQAAVGCAQLERLDALIAARAVVAARHHAHAADVPWVATAPELAGSVRSWWVYPIVLAPDAPRSPEALIAALAEHDIEARPFFEPLHRLPHLRDAPPRPHAEELAARGLCLPLYPELTEAQQAQIWSVIRGG